MNMQTKKKKETATYCKTNSKKVQLGFKVIVIFMQTQVNETLSFSVTYPAASLLHKEQ